MKIVVKKPIGDLDSVLNSRPDVNLLFRCVDCQTFLLPEEITVVTFRWRDQQTGEARSLPIEVCPQCFDKVTGPQNDGKIKDEDLPRSYFVALTREDYENTRKAERLGLIYDLQKKEMRSKLLSVN